MNKETNDLLKISEFKKFYECLMKNAPKDYTPWFFPCKPNGKDPCPEAILKIDKDSHGSWHHEVARLNFEQCIEHIKQGYNLGISAREEDSLIIGDIDEIEYIKQAPTNTLTSTSRKRAGIHFFGWDKDGSAKINLPTDVGEIRSNNQYVLSPGSYVPFNLTSVKDKEAFEKLPKEAREDKFLGYYTVRDEISPKELTFDDLPKFFQDKEKENNEAEAIIKQREETKEYSNHGKYSELFKLKVSDIVGLIPSNKRQGHPLHESDTDANFSLSKDGSLGFCWRHMVSLNAVQYLCVKCNYAKCEDAGTPHKGRGFSKIKGDKKSLIVAYKEAIKLNLIKEYVQEKKKRDFVDVTGIEEASKIFTLGNQAERFNEIQPLFYDRSGMFWLWNNKIKSWELSDEVDILNMIEKTTGKDVISSKNRTEIINALKQKGRLNIPKEINPTWIQFKNKIYDIETGENFEVTPKYFVTNPIPWEVSGDPRTPLIDKIFEEWVGKDHVQTLHEIMAYCLLPDYPINRLFCFIGAGMNGKSCFLNLLRKFIGEKNICSTELDTLLSSRFEVTRLHKKLACMLGETNFNEMNKTSIIKKLTGRDTIGFEYKNKNPFEDINYAKILIATNNLPTTTDKTIGFYRRWLIIDFPTQFSEKKDILNDIPEKEYNNLATNCIIILNDLLKKREFHNEGNIEDRMKKYEDHSNPLEKFFKEFTIEDLDQHIFKWEFEKRLNEWCKENKFRQIASNTIGKKMKESGIEDGRVSAEWYEKDNLIKKQVRAWIGIRWK